MEYCDVTYSQKAICILIGLCFCNLSYLEIWEASYVITSMTSYVLSHVIWELNTWSCFAFCKFVVGLNLRNCSSWFVTDESWWRHEPWRNGMSHWMIHLPASWRQIINFNSVFGFGWSTIFLVSWFIVKRSATLKWWLINHDSYSLCHTVWVILYVNLRHHVHRFVRDHHHVRVSDCEIGIDHHDRVPVANGIYNDHVMETLRD